MNRARTLMVLALLLLPVAAAFAGVFTYYPLTVTVEPTTTAPFIFQRGSNADRVDLSGSIEVKLRGGNTSASVKLHPSYQITYYKDVLQIVRKTNQWDRFYILVNSTGASGVAKMILYSSNGAKLVEVDLVSTGVVGPITIGSVDDYCEVDFKFNFGDSIPSNFNVELYLVVSNEEGATPR